MKTNHNKSEITFFVNKMVALLDHFAEFPEKHEKALRDLMIQTDYQTLYNKNLMLSEVHVIDCIGKNQLPNATFIAEQLDMTKGAISKITAKLLEKGMIKGDRLENNKKEVYYTLTAQGRKVFEIHEKLHDIENEKLIAMLSNYDQEQFKTIQRFLDDLLTFL